MPERHPPRIAVATFLLAACGGAAPEPAEPPPNPGPIVMQRPPQPAPAPPPAAPAVTAKPAAAAPAPAPVLSGGVTEPATRCPLTGRALFPPGTLIQNPAGKPIARFSGAEASVSVSAITLASSARAFVETGTGRGNLRVRGFVEARKLPAFTLQTVPVFAGNVVIGAQRPVSIVGAAADGKLKVEKVLATPVQQTFTAWTTCPALTLTPGVPPAWSPAGDARGYVARRGSIELFDAPQGNSVGQLYKAPAVPGLLFFSSEQANGWVHVEMHGEIIATAWAKASDLSPLPRGETMDQLAPPNTTRTPARLVVPGAPKVARALKEVMVRGAASDTELPIGVLELDAEVYVVDVMAGWASVMPRALDVVPPEGGSFWVKKSDLGL
jgi:hypothetical protein